MTAPNRPRPYPPEPATTNAPRQARLRERRKADGWRRVTLWLSPEQAERLAALGGNAWLGRTVKQLLGDALRPGADKAGDFSTSVKKAVTAVSGTAGDFSDAIKKPKAAFMTPEDKAALMVEVDSLLAQGLSSHAIARKFNAEGRRTVRGALFYGPKLLRDLRKWKGEQ